MAKPGADLTLETIKAAAKEFDIEGVTKFAWVNKGLTRITALDAAAGLSTQYSSQLNFSVVEVACH